MLNNTMVERMLFLLLTILIPAFRQHTLRYPRQKNFPAPVAAAQVPTIPNNICRQCERFRRIRALFAVNP